MPIRGQAGWKSRAKRFAELLSSNDMISSSSVDLPTNLATTTAVDAAVDNATANMATDSEVAAAVANTYTKAESDGKYSLSTHNHTGVYLTPTGDGSQLTGIDALPDQTGHTDQFLKTNGTTADWADVPPSVTGGGTDQVFYENDTNVTTDYTITTGKNAMSAGPITVNTGVTVTVPSGSEWTVV